MKNLILALSFIVAGPSIALAQAIPAASRLGDLQVGATFTYADPDYGPDGTHIKGYGFYSDFDFYKHLGAEVDFHQLTGLQSTLRQRSYEAGGRYFWNYGLFKPYGKVLYGRDVIIVKPPTGDANYAGNMVDFGGGVDIAVQRHINVRAEYEYQKWFSQSATPKGLAPMLFTIGAAYHFPPGKPRYH